MADEIDSSFSEIQEKADKPPKEGSTRAKIKLQRHSSKPCVQAYCRHPNNSPFQCKQLSIADLRKFNADFYKHAAKIDQDNWLISFIEVKPKKVTRKRQTVNANATRQRGPSETSFYMKSDHLRVRVCKEVILKALGIGRRRIEAISKNIMVNGTLRVERRGGDHKAAKFGTKREAVSNFLKQLKARESHYSRNKTHKLYLPSSIKSMKHLWKIYSETSNVPVSYEFFRRIFRNKFRIGFGSPKTDACSQCERVRNQIKTEQNALKKQALITELRIHKMRANAFYKLLNEKKTNNEIKVLCFDHQQNQVLPKVPDQLAYYSRQLYMYNFTVVDCRADGALTKDNVFIYSWKETDYAKNSSSCASAVFHALRNTDMTGIKCVRLAADACGGQNKNSAFLYMAGYWLQKYAPKEVERIEMLFPVRGHSFLPCDRVFGVLEKKLRLRERMYDPEEYIQLYKEQGTVLIPKEDWDVVDFKEVSDRVLKKPMPIKIQENKRFFFTKGKTIKVQAEANYYTALNQPQVITKKCMSFNKPPVYVEHGVNISNAKKADINKLMQEHAGEEWKTEDRFYFLASVLSGTTDDNATASTSEEQDAHVCECLEEDLPASHV